MTNKTFKEETLKAFIKQFMADTLTIHKNMILEALPKYEQLEYRGLINFASNIRPEGSETDKMVDSFNYGFRLGYKAHTDEVKQIIDNI